MCFRFGSCFGVHVHDHDDECYAPPPAASKAVPVPPRHAAATKTPAMRNGYDYSNGHHAQQGLDSGDAHHAAAYHHRPARAGDAGRRNRPSAVAATGGHGYAAGAEEKAHGYAATGADKASNCRPAAAWIDKVAHGPWNGAQATATSEHERC